ncbi:MULTISPECIES: NUDIX hydrolase [Halorussus]|uniref:NUDIX hydrolase n=1 Tax=Halorussus TaxID=1070314 RepID=UPI00209C7412|nr:NUDIX domain-containing protein [Halorussus vallis]USZ76073.1 NUDIX domain-containing protein [Halorussus vallis]
METTRHFTATVYVVHDGATALHDHKRLNIHIPPGGHVDRDELPHETAVRECREETGLTPTIVTDNGRIEMDAGRSLPRPRRQMLYDIDVLGGEVAHQHIDHIYYATVENCKIDPADGEESADVWDWYTPTDLREGDFDSDVVEIGTEAIRVVEDDSN